jgi:spermidine synthase
MAYMVITCAMFCFGLAGIYGVLRPLPETRIRPLLARLSLAFAVATLLLRPILNALPFNYNELSAQPFVQLLSFAGMYLALAAPFFLSGLIFTGVFSAFASRIQSLYFFDLVGAGIGCVILIPLITPIGPGGLLFCASALGLVASALFAERRIWIGATTVAALLLVAAPVWRSPEYFALMGHVNKRGVLAARKAGDVELTRWDPISKIAVIHMDGLPRKHLAYDGGEQSSNFYRFDGDFAGLRRRLDEGVEPIENHFWFSGVLASHYAKRDQGQRVLVIGSAGGQETAAALMYGASAVDAVEMVGTVIDLGKGPYADYTGRLFLDPRVHMVEGEGRSFLRSSHHRYDIIQIFSNHTSSSVGAGSGAMSPSYLQTAEAYREYFQHLNPDGILHVNHHVYPRLITTAALAWKQLGRDDFRRHVVVFEKPKGWDSLPTTLIKMSPWSAEEVAELVAEARLSAQPQVLVENPLDPAASFLSDAFYSGDFPDELAARIPYRVKPATDDRPYFNFLRKTFAHVAPDPQRFVDHAVSRILNARMRKFVPMDVIHLIVTAIVSLSFAFLFLFVPLRFSRVGRLRWPGKAASLLYFSCLGSGFIIIELVFIQIFMKLIGFPIYAVSTVLLTLLVAAGIGSLASHWLGIGVDRRWTWPFAGVGIVGVTLALAYPSLFQIFLAWPVLGRVVVAFCLIFPLGFFLGMPFPLGILSIEGMPRGAVAWAWAMNGLFTLIGGLASVLLSIFLGFQATLLLGLAIYALAFATFRFLRSHAGAAEAS